MIKLGNSLAIVIPKEFCEKLNIKKDIRLGYNLVIKKLERQESKIINSIVPLSK